MCAKSQASVVAHILSPGPAPDAPFSPISPGCAKVFGGQFTSAALQQFAAARLLRLPRLPPLSAWMLGAWCRAVPDGRVGVLALLREGQAQPLTLLDAVLKAQGRVAAAAAVWRWAGGSRVGPGGYSRCKWCSRAAAAAA